MRHVLIALLVAGFAGRAAAQAALTSYPASFFDASQPSTALDMVQLLPGFRIDPGDSGRRGFSGSVGNILIDGRLPTSKQENVEQLLGRIAASSVDHIELIHGAADMHGYPELANVVRKNNVSTTGRIETEIAATHFETTARRLALSLTRQGKISTWDVSASYGRDVHGFHGFGTRDRFAPDGTPIQLADYQYPELANYADFSSTYRQPVWQGDLTLGLALKQTRTYSAVAEMIRYPAPSQSSGLESQRARNGEMRANYRRLIAGWGQFEAFAVHRQREQDEISQTTSAAGGVAGTDMSRSRYHRREDVARLAWQHQQGAWTLESGAEGAITVLHSRSALTQGGVPVVLPSANLRVEEDRAEFFGTGTWRFGPVLTTELGLHYETSMLRQSGDSVLNKDLSYFKPRWLTTWDPAPGQELRLALERRVGQLELRDFSSSTSLNSNVVTAGNKNLVPTSNWRVALAWERHFWDRASLVLEARRNFVSDVTDHVPVSDGSGGIFDAVGNIGSGTIDVLEANLILPLDRLGLDGVTVKGDGRMMDSRTRDPATGQERRISGHVPFRVNLEVTYDMPQDNLRWGATFHDDARTFEYRIDEVTTTYHDIKPGAYVEYKPTPNWNFRLYGRDIGQTAFYREREIYSGLRGSSALDYVEKRKLNDGALIGINIQRAI